MRQPSRSNVNRYLLSILLALLLHSIALGQEKRLFGCVVDDQKRPVEGAYIYCKNATNIGTISNAFGEFNLTIPSTTDTIVVQFIGFETLLIDVGKTPITIVLHEKSEFIEDVMVVRDRSVSREFSVQQLSPLDIYLLPQSSGDPLRAVAALPYSTNTSESANIELRGSSSDFSRVVLNSVPLYSPIRNMQLNGVGNFSLLNTDMISEQLVYAGNPPLKYGNSIAGLVEVVTLDSLPNDHMLKMNLSLACTGLFYAKRTRRTFIQGYGNYQNSAIYLPINRKSLEFIDYFKSIDGGLNFRHYFTKSLYINVYSYAIDERYDANSTMYNYYGMLKYSNRRNFNIINLCFSQRLMRIALNHGTNVDRSQMKFGNLDILRKNREHYTSIDFMSSIGSALHVQMGVCYDYGHASFENTFPWFSFAVRPIDSTFRFNTSNRNHNLEAYTYSKVNLKNFHIGFGIRKNIPIHGQQNTLSTQVSTKYNITAQQAILLSAGVYNGYTYPNFTIMEYLPIKSKQAAIEYTFHPSRYRMSLSAYHKVEYVPVHYAHTGRQLETRTDISGIEASGQLEIGSFTLNGAYTYLCAICNNGSEVFESDNSIGHIIKCCFAYMGNRVVNMALNVSLRPGLRYTPIVGAEYVPAADCFAPIYGPTNSHQYDIYRCIDLMLNRLFSFDSWSAVLFCNIQNALNLSNIGGWIYNADYTEASPWPYQRRTIYIGATITLK